MKRISSFLYASPGLKFIPVSKLSAMRQSFTLTLLLSLLLTASLFCSTAARAQETQTIAPAVIINPTQGEPPVTMMVKGGGFDPYAAVDIYFDLTDMALTVTNGGGSFGGGGLQGGIPVPVPKDAAQGTHWITAVERYGIKAAQTKFLVGTDWAQFQFSPDHTGFNPYESILSPDTVGNLRLRWSYQTREPNRYWWPKSCSPPAVANGVVYVAESVTAFHEAWGNVFAIEANTGAPLWVNYISSNDVGMPAVADGVVYVASKYLGFPYLAGGGITALDAHTGARLWDYGGEYPVGFDAQTSSTVAKGAVYVGGCGLKDQGLVCGLYALNATTGALLWEYPIMDVYALFSSPAVANGAVYFGFFSYNGDNALIALNASTGALLWKYTTGPYFAVNSPAVANGVVYFGSSDGVYALNAATGALLWKYTTGGSSSPAVANGVVYVDGLALDAGTGELLWQSNWGGTPAIANGVLYADGLAFDAKSGELLKQYGGGGMPAIANGVLYFPSGTYLYAFDLPGSSSPDKLNPPERPDPGSLMPDWSLQPSTPVTRNPSDLN